jgi:hypothetical protein
MKHETCDHEYYPPAVTAGRSETITFFGCGNAAGNSIPPYFVYPGKKMQSRWMDGSTPLNNWQ